MTTYKKIENIKLYTQDARQKALNEHWIACKISLEKAIKLIDTL